ncbi:MAG: hypothetical protein B6D61_02410 [Bacteroidetes bacterium 4484_249]|nr:MAG: hypothetical protein B6D61_02410 [Bacteroidetes bacterium 4484_249]
MALIGTIRKQSGLLVIIIGVALAAFVLGDFLKPRQGRKQVNVAEVLGEEITYSQFDVKYEQNLENQKRQQEKENLTSEEVFRLKQQTFDQIIQKIVMDNEYHELGLVVSADELFDQIQGDDPHAYILQYFKDPETQQYNAELVRNYIKQLDQMDAKNRNQWDLFVEAIKEDRIRTKYKNLITKAYIMPDTFLYQDFNDKKTIAKIRLVGVKYNTIDDSVVTVTDKDYEKYYEEYKQNYEQEASRDIDYVVFDVKPSSKDRAAIREDVYEVFEDFKKAENVPLFVNGESDNRYDSTFYTEGKLPVRLDSTMFNSPVGTFVEPYVENNAWHMAKLVDVQFRPDSMKASHILISYSGAYGAAEDVTRINISAKALADSLFEVVKSSPAKMETLAKEFSDDPSVKQNSGDMGWFADGAMVPQFNNAVLNGKVGDIVLAETMFGYHIIKITGKKEPVKKIRVAIIDININPSQETYQEIYTKASDFQGHAVNLEAFDTLATNLGLNKRTAPNLQAMTNRIAGLDYPRGVVQWSFIEGIDVGSVSQVFTMDDKYVVAVVTKVKEKGIPELDELKETLEPLIIKELKGDIIVEKMNNASKNAKNLVQIAKNLNSKVDTVDNVTFSSRNIAGFGNEPDVLAKVFTMKTGVISKPVKGNNAAFFVIVDEIKQPEPGQDKKMFERQMLMNFTSKVNNNSFEKAIEKKADIVDNRVIFY